MKDVFFIQHSSSKLYYLKVKTKKDSLQLLLLLPHYLTSSRLIPLHPPLSGKFANTKLHKTPCKVSNFTEKLSVTKKLFPCVLSQCGWGITHIFSTPHSLVNFGVGEKEGIFPLVSSFRYTNKNPNRSLPNNLLTISPNFKCKDRLMNQYIFPTDYT